MNQATKPIGVQVFMLDGQGAHSYAIFPSHNSPTLVGQIGVTY